jgi:hypothetical protein
LLGEAQALIEKIVAEHQLEKRDVEALAIERFGAKTAALALVQMYLRETPIPPDEKPEAVEVMVEKDLSIHGLLRWLASLISSAPAGASSISRRRQSRRTRRSRCSSTACSGSLPINRRSFVCSAWARVSVSPSERMDCGGDEVVERSLERYEHTHRRHLTPPP